MVGYGNNVEFNVFYNVFLFEVWMFNGNLVGDFSMGGGCGMWDLLQFGFGRKFKLLGKENMYLVFFGLEVGFGYCIVEFYLD